MNCPNCGATMQLVPRRDYFACEYCTSFHFPKQAAASSDGVTVLGEDSDMSCPVCQQRLVVASIAKRRVLHCEACRGVLATNENFADLMKRRRATYTGGDVRPEPINPEELERTVTCPKCRKPMDTHPYYGPGNAVVDTCGQCFLIWLDHGEIAALEKAPGRR
jgi:Zn-finger nucleic acid-binding protein